MHTRWEALRFGSNCHPKHRTYPSIGDGLIAYQMSKLS